MDRNGLGEGSFDTSADLFDSSISNPPTPTLSHPPSQSSQTLKRIPKGARAQASSLLTRLIRDVLSNVNDLRPWVRLLNFSHSCFACPARGGRSRNLTTLVIRQIAAFDEGRQQSAGPATRSSGRRRQSDGDEKVANRASAKLEEGDIKGALRLLASNDALAPQSKETYDSLLALHPPCPVDRRLPPQVSACPPISVLPTEVSRAIRSFPSGSAGGPDGLRPQYLKDLLATGIGSGGTDALLGAITDFVNMLLEGRVPVSVCPILFGGSLIAISKKSGGIRPIAIGYLWRRLAGKVACHRVSEQAAALLAPRQLGFGVPGGCESAVHVARRFVENIQPDQVLLKVDFKNAFNSIRRDSILEAVSKFTPALFPFVSSAYTQGSELVMGSFTVSSEEGAQQGDPLGPLLFCLVVHDLISSLESELVLGYLDDITLGGNANTVIRDFERLESQAAGLGLSLNRSKCEISGLTATTRVQFSSHDILLRRFLSMRSVCLVRLL